MPRRISGMGKSLVFGTPEGGEPHLPNVAFGSRLCKNADTGTNCATIKSPQTNGICERFHKTILQEFYQVVFRKSNYSTHP